MASLSYRYSVSYQAYENRVVFNGTCNVTVQPAGGELSYAWYWQGANGNLIYASGQQNPTFTITNTDVSAGNHYVISVRCDVSYKYKDTDNEGNLQEKILYAEGDPITFNVYTHPGAFSFNASSDPNSINNIIANVLTADKISKWADHFNKAYHWYYQTGNNYGNLSGLKVSSNDVITANWYNNCARAMGQIGRSYTIVSGGSNGTVISAQLINDLNFYGYP